MRIAFDFNSILAHRFSGFYSYGTGLLAGFEQLEEKAEFLLFHSRRFSRQAEAVKEGLGDWAKLKSTSIKMRWLENLWRWSNSPRLEYFTGEFDLYHCCHHLMPPSKGKHRLLTVHDLRRFKIPQLYQKSKTKFFELALKRADHFIAISQATKNDLCELFDIAEGKVDVVHLAAGKEFVPASEDEKQRIKKQFAQRFGAEPGNYFVVFSSPDRRKNVARTIETFVSVRRQLPDNFKLVVAGSLPKNDKDFDSIAYGKAAESIILSGPVEDVRGLFCCSEGLIFTSLYEGFGIPILEAFGCGVPVITSNCSSMPEVAGEAALYVDPYSIESIAEAMVKVCGDVETRERLINLGLSRGREFSWKRTAEKTLGVYRKLL
jgi:glycosyltransferase involved in cell wall biosynthesis